VLVGHIRCVKTKIKSSAACACVGVPIKRGRTLAHVLHQVHAPVIKRRPCTSMPSTSPSCTPVLAVFWLSPCRSQCPNVHYLHSSGTQVRAVWGNRPVIYKQSTLPRCGLV
jgi:hypothetical protein